MVSVRDEIWAWKSITGRRKQLGFIPSEIFGLFGKKEIGECSMEWKRIWIQVERDGFRS